MANGAGSSVSQSASTEESFIGLTCAMYCACRWPLPIVAKRPKSMKTAPALSVCVKARREASSCRIFQAETAMTRKPAVAMAENSVCVYSPMTYGFVTSAKKSVISARPLRTAKPTGCCMKEFATRIQNAERLLANATIQMQRQWTFSESLSQPKSQMPRKVDSRKKAVSASSASGAPKISPMKREYSDQFMPKWNSCTIPVTTPIEKLMTKSVPKKRTSLRLASFQAGRFVRT